MKHLLSPLFILVVVDLFVTFQALVCLLPPQWSPFIGINESGRRQNARIYEKTNEGVKRKEKRMNGVVCNCGDL